jgi:hypothetical protein
MADGSIIAAIITAHISQSRPMCRQVHTGVIIQADNPVIGPYMSRAMGTIHSQQRRVIAISAVMVASRGQSTSVP